MVDYSGPICDFCGFPTDRRVTFQKTEGGRIETVKVDLCSSEDCDGVEVEDTWALLTRVGRTPPKPALAAVQSPGELLPPEKMSHPSRAATAPPRAIAPTPATTTVQAVKTTVTSGGFANVEMFTGTTPRKPDAGEDLWEYLQNLKVECNLKVVDFTEKWCPTGTKVYYDIQRGRPVSPYYITQLSRWAQIPEAAVLAMQEMRRAKTGNPYEWDPTLQQVEKVDPTPPKVDPPKEEPPKTQGTEWINHLRYKCMETDGDGNVCGATLKKGSCISHVQRAHELPSMAWAKWEVLNVPVGKSLYRCEKCDMPYPRKKDLTQHQTDGTCPVDQEERGEIPQLPHQSHTGPSILHPGDRRAGINGKAIKGEGQLIGVNPR